MTDTLVFTVSHSGIKPFYPEFLRDILRQKDNDFDFLVIEEIHQNFDMLNPVYLPSSGTPANNREQAIRYALDKGYKTLIPLDGDDRYDACKIAFLKEHRREGTLLFHDLRLIDEQGSVENPFFIGSRISDSEMIEAKDILHYNVIGFGNTAFDVPAIKSCLPIPDDVLAIDWWVSMCALLNGAQAEYRNIILSDYRIYNGNIATVNKDDASAFSRELTVKQQHYKALLKRLSVGHPYYSVINQALQEVLACERKKCFLPSEKKDGLLWWENSYEQIKKIAKECTSNGFTDKT